MYCMFVVRLIATEIKVYNHIPINNKHFLFALNIKIFHGSTVEYINIYLYVSVFY